MRKYRDLYKVENQRYEKALQIYQEYHMNEVEFISLDKRCNKAGAKVPAKTRTKTGVK